MSLNLYDSARREVTPFVPLVPGRAGIYLCGATPQLGPHLGHLRTALAFDILQRWLEASGFVVTTIRNVTDIDDKILAKAAQHDADWWAWSLVHEREFTTAYDALGIVPPAYEPRATGHVTDMVDLIARLIDRGHAYAADAAGGSGNVYFSVASFARYGELTNQKADDMRDTGEGASPGKRDPRDFALWKGSKPGEPETASWPTPWGRGRPGWHLECSAMARRYLGETFDIHGGGRDLRFPHHENEQAQSWAAGYGFARRWMHSGMLTVDGQKMGKSLDNFVTGAEALADHPAAAVRLAIVGSNYRADVDYSAAAVREAEVVWKSFVRFVTEASAVVVAATPAPPTKDLPAAFRAAMDDDLNTAKAIAVIHSEVAAGRTAFAAGRADELGRRLGSVRAMLGVLGLDPLAEPWFGERSAAAGRPERAALSALVQPLLVERRAAREAKDFARSDAIRDTLTAAGIAVQDGPQGARWNLEGA